MSNKLVQFFRLMYTGPIELNLKVGNKCFEATDEHFCQQREKIYEVLGKNSSSVTKDKNQTFKNKQVR